jgi:hypothetical protein
MISFSSVFRAAWTAFREFSRPTESGNTNPGNRMVFFKGNAGSVFGICFFLYPFDATAQQEAAIPCALRTQVFTGTKKPGEEFSPGTPLPMVAAR